MIELVEGNARDIASIMPIMTAAFDPHYGEAWTASQCLSIMALPGSHLHMAKLSGDIVGFALTRGSADEEELLLIAVLPERKRSGIATALVTAVYKTARSEGRAQLFIEVRANNPAIDFYRNVGFAPVGVRPSYYSGSNGQRFDAITMKMDI